MERERGNAICCRAELKVVSVEQREIRWSAASGLARSRSCLSLAALSEFNASQVALEGQVVEAAAGGRLIKQADLFLGRAHCLLALLARSKAQNQLQLGPARRATRGAIVSEAHSSWAYDFLMRLRCAHFTSACIRNGARETRQKSSYKQDE